MIKFALFIFLISLNFWADAQITTPAKPVLDEKTIVRGEDGMVYPYAIWKKLLATGNYGIKNRRTVDEQGRPEMLLVELSKKQIEERFKTMAKPRGSDVFVEGASFKGFKTTDINGDKIDLRAFKDKVVVLNFWFINCPPCRKEIPKLNELVTAYKNNPNVVFVAISLDERSQIIDFIRDTPFNYQIVDNGRYLADRYGVKLYPTHAIIDKNGIIKFGAVSFANNSLYWMKKTIDEALVSN